MKRKKIGCLRFMLLGFSTMVILCLTAIGLLTWDNAHLPERSEVPNRLSHQEKARLIESPTPAPNDRE